MKKIENISAATRPEVLDALRGFAPVLEYHGLLNQSTPALKALLVFYQEGGDDREFFKKPTAITRRPMHVIEVELVAVPLRSIDGLRRRPIHG